ncbi:hypothetical protein [Kribbella sp. NPDC051770]|uniref:hypothetical protein n=1 Tax=Kribbella sp. NPDC051770 TaxID=3155413 RepID=UPI0034247C80
MSVMEPGDGLADLARESAQHAEQAAAEAQAAAASAEEVARAIEPVGPAGVGDTEPSGGTVGERVAPGSASDFTGPGENEPSAGTDFSGGGYGGGPQGP